METALKAQKLKFKGEEKQPTALIAGGAGFLGAYLCEALVSQNFNVICVDNLTHGKKENIETLLSFPNFTFWEEDISKPGFTVPPTIHLTHIFQLASVEEYLASKEPTLQTLIVNSYGTKNLLDLANGKKAKFILVSSTEVFYGALSQTNLSKYFSGEHESNRLSFAEAKRFAEALAAEYLKKYNLTTVVVRIKDPYGPRMSLSPGNVLVDLISQAVHNKSIVIVGDGLKTLNPTFVTDIVFGVVKAALQGDKGDIFNLVNPEKFTERAIAEQLKKIAGIELEYKKGENVELPSHPLLFGKAEEKLGWTPKITLDQGLNQTIAFYKESARGKQVKQMIPKPPMLNLGGVRKINKNKILLARLISASLFLLAVWVIGLPLGIFAGGFYFGNRDLTTAVASLDKDETSLVVEKAEKAENVFKRSQEAVGNISWLTGLVGRGVEAQEVQSYLFMEENLSQAAKYIGNALESIQAASSKGVEPAEVLKKVGIAKGNINQAKGHLDIVEALAVSKGKLPSFAKSSFEARQSDKAKLEKLIQTLEVSLQTLQ
jgi:nucleoside-diphosphate-sugar epimerase